MVERCRPEIREGLLLHNTNPWERIDRWTGPGKRGGKSRSLGNGRSMAGSRCSVLSSAPTQRSTQPGLDPKCRAARPGPASRREPAQIAISEFHPNTRNSSTRPGLPSPKHFTHLHLAPSERPQLFPIPPGHHRPVPLLRVQVSLFAHLHRLALFKLPKSLRTTSRCQKGPWLLVAVCTSSAQLS